MSEKRLEAQAAPSGVSVVTAGISCVITELRGSAKPRIPLKLGERGSFATSVTAATNESLVLALCNGKNSTDQELGYQLHNLQLILDPTRLVQMSIQINTKSKNSH